MVHIYKIIFYEKSIKYPFFQHFDLRNGFYRSELVNRQHLGVALGAEVADHRHWNALTSWIFAEWGLLLRLENGRYFYEYAPTKQWRHSDSVNNTSGESQ